VSPVQTFNTPTTSQVEPVQVIADILQTEMGLTDKQITLAYQKYNIPNNGLFVVVGYLGPSEMIANQGYFDEDLDTEVQEVVFKHTIQIEIMSLAPDNSARIRKEEIAMALRSFYSLQQQELNLLGIAWLQSDFIDASYAEATAMYQRYITTCFVNALHRMVKGAGYLDNFPLELITDTEAAMETKADIDTSENPFAS
jgi:hypothetical protein